MTNKNAFKTPSESYFSSLEERIVVTIKRKEERKHYLREKVYPKCAAAASILLICVVATLVGLNFSKKETQHNLAKQTPITQKTIQPLQKQTTINNSNSKKTIKISKTNKNKKHLHNTNSQPKLQEKSNNINLTKDEVEYLSNYLQGDIMNDYLAEF